MNDIGGSSGKKSRSTKHMGKRLAMVAMVAALIIACAWGVATLVKSLSPDNPPDPGTVLTLPSDTTTDGTDTSTTPVSDDVITTPPVITPNITDAQAQKQGVYTFLLMGMDNYGTLTDVLMVVYFDTVNNKLNVLNIPRDTYSNAAPKVVTVNGNKVDYFHINLAYSFRGLEGLQSEIMNLIGYVPSFHVKVGLNGVESIINKIGGVYFNVPQIMDYDDPTQNLHIHLTAGEQWLDGNESLQLLRYRHGYALGDIQRVKVCQDFLKALAEQMLSTATLTKAVELAGTVADNVKTDLTAENLIWLAKQAMELTSEDIQFIMLPGGLVEGTPYWYPNEDRILQTVNAYFNPLTEDITTLNIVETPK